VRVREVVSNLIANALRYTAGGGAVTVTAALAGAEVVVEVRDTGHGIAPEALPHIFDRFYKSEESRGSGLGLAIARSLAVAHGGNLTAASTLGQGATMRLTLPTKDPYP
jgi:signal transduction histidine kinase